MSKVWLVTGGSRSLGRALSRAVLASGDRLVATARRPERLADLVDRYGERLRVVAPDAVAPEGARGAVGAAVTAFGRLDVVVNNAGYTNVGSIERTPLEELEAQISTDLWGPIRVAHAALPVMRGQRAGHIVLVSKRDGRRARPSLGAYQTTARGLEGFSEALAAEVAPLGIRVTIVEVGVPAGDRARAPVAAHDGIAGHRAAGEVVALAGEAAPLDDSPRAVQEIMRVVAEDHPPLRLPLGAEAARLAEVGACSLRCEQYGR